MKHLKVAASVVNLTILIFCSISCSSVPRSPTGSRNVPAVAGEHGILASCLPDAVAIRKAAMMVRLVPSSVSNLKSNCRCAIRLN